MFKQFTFLLDTYSSIALNQCGRRKVSVGAARLLGFLTVFLASCGSSRELELDFNNRTVVASDISLSGATFQSDGSLLAWTEHGELYQAEHQSLIEVGSFNTPGLTLLSAVRTSGQINGVGTIGDSIVLLSHKSAVGVKDFAVPRTLVVKNSGQEWVFAGITHSDSVRVHWVSAKGTIRNTYTSYQLGAVPDQPLPSVVLEAVGSRVAVLSLGDSVRMQCFGNTRPNKVVSLDREAVLPSTGYDTTAAAAWIVGSLVALDAGYLATLSDLRSSSRLLLIFSVDCRFMRARLIDQPVVPATTDPSTRRLVAARSNEGDELLEFTWRWGALIKTHSIK